MVFGNVARNMNQGNLLNDEQFSKIMTEPSKQDVFLLTPSCSTQDLKFGGCELSRSLYRALKWRQPPNESRMARSFRGPGEAVR